MNTRDASDLTELSEAIARWRQAAEDCEVAERSFKDSAKRTQLLRVYVDCLIAVVVARGLLTPTSPDSVEAAKVVVCFRAAVEEESASREDRRLKRERYESEEAESDGLDF